MVWLWLDVPLIGSLSMGAYWAFYVRGLVVLATSAICNLQSNGMIQKTCSICPSLNPDIWKHVLLSCIQLHLYTLRIKWYNKAVWELRKLISQHSSSRCFILMNAITYNSTPLDNTVLPWLLPCTCLLPWCQCNAWFKRDLLCVQGLPYHSDPPLALTLPLIFNSLNLHTIAIAFYQKPLPQSNTNTNHLSMSFVLAIGSLPPSWSSL